MERESSIDARVFLYYPQLGRVLRHLEERIEESLSLKEAAAIAGMADCHFSTFFHQKTGVTFRDWMASVRIRRAKQLLRERKATITEVSYRVGFRDLRTFERVFKRHADCTPSAYRRRITSGESI